VARAAEIERQFRAQGGGALLDEARAKHAPAQIWPLMFEYAWVASCFDKVILQEPELAGFVGATHNQYVNEFTHLDRERISLAVQRVCRTHAERAIQAMNRYPSQEALVRREAEKKRRHIPLRKLLAQAPDVLTAICPCWMTSPLSVSQLLDAERRYFDVVIFDEASQIPPEDAAPAILRASQVVVAGDQHQLPPTRFFATGEDDPAEEDELLASQGFESLLDLMTGFMGNWWLEWHYRSRDEALIAFSNHYIYRDRLITFPSTSGLPGLSHVLVQPEASTLPERDDELYSSPAEVRKVVDLIINHARMHPTESLGVITLGIRHAERVEEELERRLPGYPELDAFFTQNRPEPFFIKNLERVQGDERDAILLSIGYCKNRAGKLPYRFGPLLTQGGERRLNVAITRARDRLTLVSSFSHYDMDPNRSSAEGVKLLRAYLEYAAGQGRDLATARASNVTLNPFEQDVYNALTARGIPLVPQWGSSAYRIDFAAQHPQQPGRLVLAIECDGASYHSASTARDRDRLRQQQLEALGWRFHRIWSTDWFMRREQEIDRAVAAYRAAVERSDQALATRKALEIEPAAQTDPVVSAVAAAPGSADVLGRSLPLGSAAVLSRPLPPTADISAASSTPAPERSARPDIPHYASIDKYRQKDLVTLIRWISSDNLLRTDEEIIDEMVKELGFKRRGPRIEDVLRQAIDASRRPSTNLRDHA
jgi:very-short-patch-repair endonuclease